MLGALTVLLVFQLVGDAVAHGLDLPIPGPVIGFALLFLALLARSGVPDDLRDTATGLLRHLSLLFVPAGVGSVTGTFLPCRAFQKKSGLKPGTGTRPVPMISMPPRRKGR